MTAERKGLRCNVCTGCGLCPGVQQPNRTYQKLDIISECLLPESAPHLRDAAGAGFFGVNAAAEYVVAIDIGTTTIAMVLYDGTGKALGRYAAVNPQRKYGADVLSRIKACEDKAKAEDMQALVYRELEKGLAALRKDIPQGASVCIYAAANTTETYLCMGWNPEELGQAPFTVSRKEAGRLYIGDSEICFFPPLSAFVGGDIVSGIFALNMAESDRLTLFIDLGTNGEIVLGNRDRMLACATAAGPAFEGGVNSGIWGADMTSILASLRKSGYLDEDGLIKEPYFEKGVRAGNVTVTMEAVRAVQMAKAAIAAGVEILMQNFGITEEAVERVVLAGGFGYFLDPAAAAEIGLLPEKLCKKAISGGNTSLAGCMKAGIVSGAGGAADTLQGKLSAILDKVVCVNLANEASFNEKYIEHLALKKF